MRLLELTSDVVFKAFMLSNKNKLYKAKLLSVITKIPEKEFLKASYQSLELPISFSSDKIYKTDIIVKISNYIINIEMNRDYYKGLFIKNSMYYNKLKSEDLEIGENYINVKKIIQINFDNFSKYNGNKLIYKFKMLEVNTYEEEYENEIESYHIDLAYLNNKCYNELNDEEKIIYLFHEKEIDKMRSENYMNEAIDEIERISNDKKIIGLYDKEAVEKKILNSRLIEAREEGEISGENKKEKEVALNMINMGLDDNTIIKSLNISKEDLDNIKGSRL